MADMIESSPLSNYDIYMKSVTGIPDAIHTKPTTLRTLTPIREATQTWIVQTYRHFERGDVIFLDCVAADGSIRLALPPAVAVAIARQRDALSAKRRRDSGKAEAAKRKAAGIQPGFMKKRKPKGA